MMSFCACLFFEGGLVFAKPMRETHYRTMLDPFHMKYGKVLTAVMSLASIVLDVFLVPGTLTGLGMLYT